MRRHGRRDSFHGAAVGMYRDLGCSVLDLGNCGQGCPDLCVSVAGATQLVEVKAAKGKLTSDQQQFFAAWKDEIVIVRTLEEVVIHVGNMRKRGGVR